MYFPNFIFLRKRLKSSHTSLKKLEKEDFNSINRYFISSLEIVSPLMDEDGSTHTYFSHYPLFGIPTEVEDCEILYKNDNL